MKYKRSSFRPTTVRLWGFIYALRGWRFYEREFYERKAGVPTFDVHGTPSLLISLLRYVVVIIPAAWILSRLCGFGPAGVWNAFWVAELITAVCAVFIYRGAVKGQRD